MKTFHIVNIALLFFGFNLLHTMDLDPDLQVNTKNQSTIEQLFQNQPNQIQQSGQGPLTNQMTQEINEEPSEVQNPEVQNILAPVVEYLKQQPTHHKVFQRGQNAPRGVIRRCDISALSGAVFSNDGNKVLTVSLDGTVLIYDVETGLVLRTLSCTGGGAFVRVSFSPDDTKVLTISKGVMQLWDVHTGRELKRVANIKDAMFSSDNQKVLTLSSSNHVELWNAQMSRALYYMGRMGSRFEILTAKLSTDATKIIGIARKRPVENSPGENMVYIRDVQTYRLLRVFKRDQGYQITYAELSPDGTKVIIKSQIPARSAAYTNHKVQIYAVQTGELLRSFAYVAFPDSDTLLNIKKPTSFSPDGTKIVVSLGDRTGAIYDVSTGQLLQEFEGHFGNYLEFSPDGTKILSDDANSLVRIWDVQTGRLLQDIQGALTLLGHQSVTFSPDSKKLLTVSLNEARIYFIKDKENLLRWLTEMPNATIGYPGTGSVLADIIHRMCDAHKKRDYLVVSPEEVSFLNNTFFVPNDIRNLLIQYLGELRVSESVNNAGCLIL